MEPCSMRDLFKLQTIGRSRGGLGEKGGPGVTVRPAHSIHGARPTQYTACCPRNTRRVAHSMYRTYRPFSGLLGKIPIHLTLFWMITKQLHHICFLTFGSTNLSGWTHGIK